MKIVAQNHISNSPLISLSLFLRLGIQLCFTASMPMLLFTTNQICYHECENKMKRSQIGVRKRISKLLCVKSTFFFFLFDLVSNFRPKPDIYPSMAKTSPAWLVFKPIQNTTIFIPVYKIYWSYRLVRYEIVFLEYNASIKRNFS